MEDNTKSLDVGVRDVRNSLSLRGLEVATLIILLAMVFWSVGPLIEEWGLFRSFNKDGIGYIFTYFPAIPMRPFHLVAYGLQWILGQGNPIGVAAGTGLLMVLRYFAARWAISPLITSPYLRWAIATLAAVLLTWPGAWLGRYGSAQLSAVFFLIALGFSIRVFRSRSIGHAVGCAAFAALLLSTYQGLAICLMAIPLASLFWRTPETQASIKPYLAGVTRVTVSIAVGVIAYFLYCYVVSHALGSGGYEGTLASDSARLLTLVGLADHIRTAFLTAYGRNVLVLPTLLLMAFLLCRGSLISPIAIRSRILLAVLLVLLIVLLPLLSVVYVYAAHIRDVDRVLFPVSSGFILVCATVLSWKGSFRVGEGYEAVVAVVAILVSSLLISGEVRGYKEIQNDVLFQVFAEAEKSNSRSVLLRDTTGVLGDVYTLYEPLVNDAAVVLGRQIDISICTPEGVDRIHPVAQRFPIPTTSRCEAMPFKSEALLILTARWENQLIKVGVD